MGHPPFGHNGEAALDDCMAEFGGFEGNAQTLRILSRLEKRRNLSLGEDSSPITADGKDQRVGLNLTFRTLAAALKYDREIPLRRADRDDPDKVCKGYYKTEAGVVEKIKSHVVGKRIPPAGQFKTVECQIMDVSDDIAYSTYDLEDAFKAGFLTPLSMLSASSDLVGRVCSKVEQRCEVAFPHRNCSFKSEDLYKILINVFLHLFILDRDERTMGKLKQIRTIEQRVRVAARAFQGSANLAADGYLRTDFTSSLVGRFLRNVRARYDSDQPQLSKVWLDFDTFRMVEVLKNFAFEALIMSSMLKVAEHRGRDIVTKIFTALDSPSGHLLLPDDFRLLHKSVSAIDEKKRVICNFIAGMTDKYALEFYDRLYSARPESIFKPI